MHPNSRASVICETCGTAFQVHASVRFTRLYCSTACASIAHRGEEGLTPLNVARFWTMVDSSAGPNKCWPYTGPVDRHGYGRFSIRQHRHKASRVAAECILGPCPDGLRVCHHCDNPACCNPKHLYYGTAKDNTQDMIQRGRAKFFDLHELRGERHPNARFTEEQVIEFRRRWARAPFDVKAEAARHGVAPQSIWAIIKQKNWKHLPSVGELREAS